MVDAKRAKLESSVRRHSQAGSRLYAPFRQLGHIINDLPFDVQVRGTQYVLTTCIGRAVQLYDCANMGLLFVGRDVAAPIRKVISLGNDTLLGTGSAIVAQRRGKDVWSIDVGAEVVDMVAFGTWLVAATSKPDFRVYNLGARDEEYATLSLAGHAAVTGMLHMPTYLNKVVIGRDDGTLELWNVRTGKRIFKTESFGAAVSCISAAPVLDVLGVGCVDGSIHVYNLRTAEIILKLSQKGKVNSLSFRTDGVHALATASPSGDIAFWDLAKRRISYLHRGAHSGAVTHVHYLQGQPLCMSSGTDNAVKQWIFDSIDGALPRLLKSRSGHSAPPMSLQFYGEETSQFLLTASRDRSVRATGVYRDAQSTELSQGHIESEARKKLARGQVRDSIAATIDGLKLNEVIAISHSTQRERDWDNIVTAHRDDSAARSWTWANRRLGQHILPTKDKSAVRSVCVTRCGNFALIGSALGRTDLFNLQSGLHRRSFVASGSDKPVTGIAVDALNDTVVTASLDGHLRFYDFRTGLLKGTLDIGSGIAILRHHARADLIAVACDDLGLRVVDVETRRIVRELYGPTNRITDMCFSDDARWIIVAAADRSLRTFDLPTAHCIDAVRTKSVVTAIAYSPTGDYLATASVDDIGVSLWTNKTQFSSVAPTRVEIAEADLPELGADGLQPSSSGVGGVSAVGLALAEVEEDDEEKDEKPDAALLQADTTVAQISDDLQTLSLLPRHRFQSLVHLDAIRERNKPRETAEQRARRQQQEAKRLPFDLGTLRDLRQKEGLAASLDAQEKSYQRDADHLREARIRDRMLRTIEEAEASDAIAIDRNTDDLPTVTDLAPLPIAQLLSLYASGRGVKSRSVLLNDAVASKLKGLGPAQVDVLIAMLSDGTVSAFSASYDDETTDRVDERVVLMHLLTDRLRLRRDYELVQAWVRTLLRHWQAAFATELSHNHDLNHALTQLDAALHAESQRLAERLLYAQGVLRHLATVG
ncbi:rRNA-processing protein utp21 [Savitreella phatthalungensis]